MKLAPVFYTLAQIKFNPVSQLSEYVSKFQEKLRHINFPDFNENEITGLIIRQSNNLEPSINQKKTTKWEFNNIDQTEGYILLNDALSFHTTNYDTFDSFLDKLLNGLELLHEIINISYVDRLGLRYLDLINPNTDKKIDDYLKKEFLGLTNIMKGEFKHSFSETAIEINNGTLVVKSFISNESALLPPDLSPLNLKLSPRFNNLEKGMKSILDTDYFSEKRSIFNLDDIKQQLISSHTIISESFKSSVTDFAIDSWR